MGKHITEHLNRNGAHLNLDTPGLHGYWSPNTDVYETKELLIIKMELAGVKKNDIEITLIERSLIIRGYRRDACPQQKNRCSFRQMEIDHGYFERRIVLPCVVDALSASTSFHDGLLRIELPKTTRGKHTSVTVVIEKIS